MNKEILKIADLSGQELVDLLEDKYGKNSSDVIHAELLKRNTEALIESNKSAGRFSNVTTGLTLIMTALVLIQIIFALFTSNLQMALKWILLVMFIIFILSLFKDLLNDMKH